MTLSLMNNDLELVENLVEQWKSTRQWAEQMLVDSIGLASAEEILETEHRGNNPIPGTNWFYRTHGVGVDVYQHGNKGGIDFDFDKPEPDEYGLREFMAKQYNAGALTKRDYRPLMQDGKRWTKAVRKVLGRRKR